jgi:hypothetical protein
MQNPLTAVVGAVKDAAGSAVTAAGAAANTAAAGAAANTAAAAAAAATGAGADKSTLLPVKVSVQSAGVVPLKAAAGISSGAFAQVVGMLPGQAFNPIKQFVGTERLE